MTAVEIKNDISVKSRLVGMTDEQLKVIDFIIDYSFKDNQEVYTNGTILVPLFRVLDAISQEGNQYQESCEPLNQNNMTPKEKAKELVEKFIPHTRVFHETLGWEDYIDSAKKCALIAVDEIILSNPHSNPFNTDVYSTMDYWLQVKTEIENL